MKPVFFSALLACVATTFAPAQVIHLSLEGTVTDKFGGESWWNGAGSGMGERATLDFYYAANLSALPQDPGIPYQVYESNGAANNFWRLRYGGIDVSAPFERLEVSDFALSVFDFDLATLTTLDLRLRFESNAWPDFALPQPPFPPFTPAFSTFVFDTFSGFGLEPGSLYVGIDRLEAEVVPSSAPVPEPATYAIGLVAVIAAVILRRRFHRGSQDRALI